MPLTTIQQFHNTPIYTSYRWLCDYEYIVIIVLHSVACVLFVDVVVVCTCVCVFMNVYPHAHSSPTKHPLPHTLPPIHTHTRGLHVTHTTHSPGCSASISARSFSEYNPTLLSVGYRSASSARCSFADIGFFVCLLIVCLLLKGVCAASGSAPSAPALGTMSSLRNKRLFSLSKRAKFVCVCVCEKK
jgi:hypothetical protein